MNAESLPACSQMPFMDFLCQSTALKALTWWTHAFHDLETCSLKHCPILWMGHWFALSFTICLFGPFRRMGLPQQLTNYSRKHPVGTYPTLPHCLWNTSLWNSSSAANHTLRHWYSLLPRALSSLLYHIQKHSQSYQSHIIALDQNPSNKACIIH